MHTMTKIIFHTYHSGPFLNNLNEIIYMAWKATLQASQISSKFFGLVLQASSFILPQICLIIFISGDCAGHPWRTLIAFPLRNEKLHRGTWGMTRSSILLKNLTPLVVGNVQEGSDLGGKIFGTTNVTIHLTDLFGTSVLDVTPNHNLSTSKFDCLLSEPWVQMGPRGSSTILAAHRMELNWRFIWKKTSSPLFCCPTFHQAVGLGIRNTVS